MENSFNIDLQKIQNWLSKTTEYYSDWDWDGETLTVFGDRVEKYSREDLIECRCLQGELTQGRESLTKTFYFPLIDLQCTNNSKWNEMIEKS